MFILFFHLSGLALLEILFYFYYVGPMEGKEFKKAIKTSINSQELINIIQFQNPYSSNDLIFLNNYTDYYSNYYSSIVNEKEHERELYNNKLFVKSMYCWSIIISITLFVSALEFYYYYYKFKKKKKINEMFSRANVEMVEYNIANRQRVDSGSHDDIQEDEKFIDFTIVRKKVFLKFGHLILLLSMILGFEFWFFNNIVIKYKIISREELAFLILQQFEIILNSLTN